MAMTTTYTYSKTFTRSNARYVASKVAADLRLLQRFYGRPTDAQIDAYTGELVELLVGGYVQRVTYGFKRDGAWVVALRYEARVDGTLDADNRAGKVIPGININGANWSSYLVYSGAWDLLDAADRARIKASLPVERTDGAKPSSSNGSWVQDHSYSAGGSGVRRASFRPW
jgi:Bacterial HORMA domain family 1